MNLYSNKQRWKILLLVLAVFIIAVTLWYTNEVAHKIREEEHQKVRLWSDAIKKRAELVKFTEELFDKLQEQERVKVENWAEAIRLINRDDYEADLTFYSRIIYGNTDIPFILLSDKDTIAGYRNIPVELAETPGYLDSLKTAISEKRKPITIDLAPPNKQFIYYDDSYTTKKLKVTLNDLINSFISETVINAASVPVILTDSTRRVVFRSGNIDTTLISNPDLIEARINDMASANPPIEIKLSGKGKNYIYYEDSLVLKQLSYFPIVQLILIGVFLLAAYLIFSTFRKAEQNQVWVGMAKETAHQLGTPLSSLMAWMSLLPDQGVNDDTVQEINKDLDRLGMITERFSKIGSQPELESDLVFDAVESSIIYLKKRVSKKVTFQITGDRNIHALISRPLFSWVLENLIKNAADSMVGEGSINAEILKEGTSVFVDITDTGKGIPKSKFKTVFEPGFTTKKRGWGLGLSLCKRIIENYHNGKIFVKRSEQGVGTTFRIQLTLSA